MTSHNELLIARAKQYEAAGYDFFHALGLATFQTRIDAWPSGWGDDFVAIIFGDFDTPDDDLEFGALNIAIECEPLKKTVARSARTVLRARVRVPDKSVAAIKDAMRRLNLLVGLLSFTNQGAPIRWWSYVTHAGGGGIGYKLQAERPLGLLALVELLPDAARRRVSAALYWIREPRGMLFEQPRTDQLAVYAGYWNAFECLVDAANLIVPREKLDRGKKKEQIRARLAQAADEVGPGDIEAIYREVISPGLRPKAEYAVKLCAGDTAADFIRECFDVEPAERQLYRLRNGINHGTLDVDDPETTILLDARFPMLWKLVFTMLNGVLTVNLRKIAA